MKKFDPTETIESQERYIMKLERESKKLEMETKNAEQKFAQLEEELLNTKKAHKMQLLEIQNKLKDQSRTIKELKHTGNVSVRQIEELNVQQSANQESAISKIKGLEDKNELLKIENEDLINTITQNQVQLMEKDNEISTIQTQINKLQNELENIRKHELNELQQKLAVKEKLAEQQNEAVNKLTLDIKKQEVEIAELEYKLSNEQAKRAEADELQKKIEKQEDVIIHLRKTNITNEEKTKEVREQLNTANIQINDLLQKMKTLQEKESLKDIKISYFQIKLP
jgi:chromosome segregation ATPase